MCPEVRNNDERMKLLSHDLLPESFRDNTFYTVPAWRQQVTVDEDVSSSLSLLRQKETFSSATNYNRFSSTRTLRPFLARTCRNSHQLSCSPAAMTYCATTVDTHAFTAFLRLAIKTHSYFCPLKTSSQSTFPPINDLIGTWYVCAVRDAGVPIEWIHVGGALHAMLLLNCACERSFS